MSKVTADVVGNSSSGLSRGWISDISAFVDVEAGPIAGGNASSLVVMIVVPGGAVSLGVSWTVSTGTESEPAS
jgi:hypothetical protein